MALEKELSLNDIIGNNQEDADKIVYAAFDKAIKANEYEPVPDEIYDNLTNELHNVNYYLIGDSLVLYFNPYQIGPYAMGAPSVEIRYSDKETPIKVDLSGVYPEKFEFELDGNPTTGYSWEITSDDSDKIKVEKEYIPSEKAEGLVGVGGKYKFTVTGTAAGNCSVKCSYMRS